MKNASNWPRVILSSILSLGITTVEPALAKPHVKKKPALARTKNRPPAVVASSPPPPEPPAIPAQVLELLNQVEDKTVRILREDFHENRCVPFEGSVVVVEFGRITCSNAIYHFDTDAPQPYWYETDVRRNTIEVKTLVDYPDKGKGYTLTTITLGGGAEERGFFIATKG